MMTRKEVQEAARRRAALTFDPQAGRSFVQRALEQQAEARKVAPKERAYLRERKASRNV